MHSAKYLKRHKKRGQHHIELAKKDRELKLKEAKNIEESVRYIERKIAKVELSHAEAWQQLDKIEQLSRCAEKLRAPEPKPVKNKPRLYNLT